jgi:predicted transposase/invertase (TIGR01784 family)
MLESYGRERFAAEKKQCREEGEQSGFKKGIKIGFARGEQSGFEKGEQSGFEKGEQSGFEKGIEQSKENFALNMLKNNYRLEEISRMTGLTMERVLQIARNNNLEDS